MDVATVANGRTLPNDGDSSRLRHLQIVASCLLGYMLVLAAWSAPSAPIIDDPAPTSEVKIEAAFVYKFLSYVEWPSSALPSASAPIVVAVLGADGIAGELEAIVANRRVGQHPIEVRRVDAAHALDGAQVLFIGRREAIALRQLAPVAERRSVLVITDFDDALEHGSIINLVVVDNHVRFEVSLEEAERSALKLSSRMLGVALWVNPAR